MSVPGGHGGQQVRTAEVAASLCLATDLGMGLPFEHGLRGTLLAARLAERMGTSSDTASDTFYVSLLMYSGCTADGELTAELFEGGLTKHFLPGIHGSPGEAVRGIIRAIPDSDAPAPVRAVQVMRRAPRVARTRMAHQRTLCEVGEMLAARLGLPPSVQDVFATLTERWDGKGGLGRAKGEAVPLALRIAHVASDANLQRLVHGPEAALDIVRERGGRAFDPDVVACLSASAGELLAPEPELEVWDAVLSCEPPPHRVLRGDDVDRALGAMGDFADLLSPDLAGHSAGVAALAGAAAELCGFASSDVALVRRAGLVHDVGQVAVSAAVWQRPGPLSADDSEQVRLHAYHGERILTRSPFLASLATVAGAHHERLDGSGYHRGATASTLSPPARLLAAADVYHAMTEPRPHRLALASEQAADEVGHLANEGRLDVDVVVAVLEAAGQQVPPMARPAGLTEREVEVVALLARGVQTKQIARALGISAKTADRHIQNAYAKIGVSTRAAAALFAMEHGLVAWGELLMAQAEAQS